MPCCPGIGRRSHNARRYPNIRAPRFANEQTSHASRRDARRGWLDAYIASTVLGSFGAFALWAYEIGQRRPAHPGRTDMLRDLSAQFDESASTMSSSLASAISGLCYSTTKTITMNVERTYRWTRRKGDGRRRYAATTNRPQPNWGVRLLPRPDATLRRRTIGRLSPLSQVEFVNLADKLCYFRRLPWDFQR